MQSWVCKPWGKMSALLAILSVEGRGEFVDRDVVRSRSYRPGVMGGIGLSWATGTAQVVPSSSGSGPTFPETASGNGQVSGERETGFVHTDVWQQNKKLTTKTEDSPAYFGPVNGDLTWGF